VYDILRIVIVILVVLKKYNPEQVIHPNRNEQPAITKPIIKSIVSPNEITT